MRMETFIRKSLRLKAHLATEIQEREAEQSLVVHMERLGQRRLRCGECGRPTSRVAPTRPSGPPVARSGDARAYRRVGLRALPRLVRPLRAAGGTDPPWADKWQRVTHALFSAVVGLTRQMDWSAVAQHVRLNWKTVAAVVEGAVLWGLQHRPWRPLHWLGLDEVSRRKGQQALTVVYDLARGRVVCVGRDRTTETMTRFFAWLGWRRARAIRAVCCELCRLPRCGPHPSATGDCRL